MPQVASFEADIILIYNIMMEYCSSLKMTFFHIFEELNFCYVHSHALHHRMILLYVKKASCGLNGFAHAH